MKIGYSFWGFLGAGVVDTPDGGRSHRRPFIDALAGRGHQLVLLQADRDRLEAGDILDAYSFDTGLPELDALFLEWRWPIPGRNTTACGTPGHTCDLHRQDELLRHYTIKLDVPTIIWDKDRRLSAGDPWRRHPRVAVCEAAFSPTPGSTSLHFPVDDQWLDGAAPSTLATTTRPLSVIYVGNQYERDDAFDRYFVPASARHPHAVAGKWPKTGRWPHVTFLGRIGFRAAMEMYTTALATVLLLPERYARVGQMTQRIFEAALAGCLPLCPTSVRYADRFVPQPLLVRDGHDVADRLQQLRAQAGTAAHRQLIADSVSRLEPFRLSRQVAVLDDLLDALVRTGVHR